MEINKKISEAVKELNRIRWSKKTPEERKLIMAKVTRARMEKRAKNKI